MAQHNETGAWGEKAAEEYLIREGYAIVDRNVRFGHADRDEVDLIAMKDGDIAFIEVKTRSGDHEDPAAAVDNNKLRRYCRFADSYVRKYDLPADPRIDVIAIIGSPGQGVERLEHLRNCYLPSLTPGRIPRLPLFDD